MSTGLSEWLRKEMDKEGLSLRKAGVKTGLSHGTIADVLRGAPPNGETIRKLAEAFSKDGQKLALEDSLLTLAGYRSERAGTKQVGRLMDIAAHFNEAQLSLVVHFAEFLNDDREAILAEQEGGGSLPDLLGKLEGTQHSGRG